ncbi:gp58-like family protein [Streptococcus pluranimalium]
MKPVLYPKTETTYVDFGFGEISDALSVEVTRERNGDYSLYMKYPHDGVFADKLQKEMQLKADAGPRTKWQTFDVVRINKKSTDYIEVYAKHISFRLSGAVLKNGVTLTDVDARTALAQWKNNLVSDTVFDIDSDITTTGSVAWAIDKVTNAREALGGVSGSILDVYGGEYEFDNQLVKLHKQMGRKAPIVLEYGRNIQEIEVDDDDSEVYNSILPFAKITQQEDEKSIEVLTTLPEIYIDGPFIGDYQRRIIKQVDFSTKFDSEKNKPTVEKLRSLAMSYVKSNEVGKPKTTIDVKYVDLASTLDYADMQVMEEVELCDILPLYYPKFGITSANEKVVKTVYDVYNDEYISLTLGTIGQTLRSQLSESTSGRIEALENKQKQFETELPTYLTNASGNRNWYDTPDDTQEHKIGDIWFEKNGQYERMYVWDGNQWILKIDTEDPDRIKRSIDQQFEDFNTSYDEAKALQDKQIADVLAKAGANKSLAEEAKRVGDQAKLDAANALSSVQTVKDEAIAEARRLDTIVRKDTETKLATAKSQAIEEAQRLVDGTKGELAQRLSSAETEITKTNDEIKTLAKKSELDTVNNRLSSTESSVTHMSDKIETEISRIEGKIPNEIGGRNLLLNSDFSKSTKGYSFTVDGQIYDTTATNWGTYNGGIANAKTSYHAYVADFEGRKNAIIYNESDGSRNWKGILQILDDRMPQTTNNFILSADVFVTGAGTKLFGGFYYCDKSGKYNFHSGYFRFDTSSFEIGKWQRVNVTVPFEKEKADFSKSVRFYIYAYNFGTNAILAIDNVKLETGKIATGHILATEDLTEDIETVKTTITKTAEGVKQLSTKAIETDSKISNSETKINQLIGEVSTKVAQRDYDSLLGRVSSAETTIRTQAGQIEQRLTSTQVNQLIDTKGFATTSTVQNIVQNTADSFTQTISRVEGKIPTEIGGRNLWIKKDSYGYSAVESLPSNHITGQSECYRLENGVALIFNIEPDFSSRLYGKVTFTAWVKYENVVQGANAWNVFNCFKHVLYRKNSKTGVTSTADYTALKSFTGTSDWQKITVTYDYGQNTNYDQLKTQLRFYVERATSGTAWVTGIKVELGSIATDYSLAIEDNITIASFNEVKDTVDAHTRTIGDIEGNVSRVTQTANGLVQEVSGANGLKTQVSQLKDSWAVKLSGPDGLKTAINASTDGIRLLGKNIHLDGNTLIDNGVIKSAMIGHAQINTAHIGTIDARQANIINLNASNITSGQITGINMRGGVLSAINGNTVFDLNNAKLSFNSDAKIEFYNNNNAFRRVVSGYGNQFIKFKTGGFTRDGKTGWNANTTVIGSNRGGTESDENGEFAGLRIWNMKLPNQNKSADQIDIIGDTVAIMDSATGGSRSPWVFYNHNGTNQLAFVGNAENSKQHFIGTTDRPFEQIHGKTIVASRDMFLQGERVAKMIKDLALKIGYKGNDGWADRIG